MPQVKLVMLFSPAGGNDTVTGELGNDVVFGEFGNDLLQGKLGNDTIYGGAGRDQIIGDDGNDELYGDEGNDLIWGNEGNDLLQGGLGNDGLFGSTGQDTFVIEIGAGIDNIRDFEIGTDLIGLTGGLAFSDLIKTQRGNSTWLRSDRQVLAILSDVNSNLLTENSFTNLSDS